MEVTLNGSQRLSSRHHDKRHADRCHCCPFGYHIDLDFLKYCEKFTRNNGQTAVVPRARRVHRRQRKSMDVMLGLQESPTSPVAPLTPIHLSPVVSQTDAVDCAKRREFIRNAIDEISSDFEQEMQNSPPSRPLPPPPVKRSLSPPPVPVRSTVPGAAIEKLRVENQRLRQQNIELQLQINRITTKPLKRDVSTNCLIPPDLPSIKSVRSVTTNTAVSVVPITKNVMTQSDKIAEKARPKVFSTGTETKINTRNCYQQTEIELPTPTPIVPVPIVSSKTSATNTERIHYHDKATDYQHPLMMDRGSMTTCQIVTISTGSQTDIVRMPSPRRDFDEKQSVSLNMLFKDPNLLPSPLPEDIKSLETVRIEKPSVRHKIIQTDEKETMSKECQVSPLTNHKSVQCASISTVTNHTSTYDLIKYQDHSTQTLMQPKTESSQMTELTSTNEIWPLINTYFISTLNTSESPESNLNPQAISSHIFIKCAANYCDKCKEDLKSLANKWNNKPLPPPLKRQDTYTVDQPPPTTVKVPTVPTPTTSPVADENDDNKSRSLSKEPCPAEVYLRLSALNESESTNSSQEREIKVEEKKEIEPIVDQEPIRKPSDKMMKALKDTVDTIATTGFAAEKAVTIVRDEWFNVTSVPNASPFNVASYLDAIDAFGAKLWFNVMEFVVQLKDENGNTALHYAVSHGNYDIITLLLDSRYCEYNAVNKAGYTACMLLALSKSIPPEQSPTVQRLFSHADINMVAKKHGQTALMLAAAHGNRDMVKMLIEAGADLNVQDLDGSTALMCAAEHGRIDIIKVLLAHPDCDSTVQDVDGSTALKIAIDAGFRDIGVLLYAHEHMMRQKSPYSTLRRGSAHRSPIGTPLPSPKLSSNRKHKK